MSREEEVQGYKTSTGNKLQSSLAGEVNTLEMACDQKEHKSDFLPIHPLHCNL